MTNDPTTNETPEKLPEQELQNQSGDNSGNTEMPAEASDALPSEDQQPGESADGDTATEERTDDTAATVAETTEVTETTESTEVTEVVEAPVVEVVEAPAVEAPAEEVAETPAAEAPAAEVAETPAAEAPAEEVAETPATETPAAEAPATETAAAETSDTEGDDAAAAGQGKRSKKKSRLSDEEAQPIWDELVAAYEQGAILPFTLLRSTKGGAIAEYKGLEGFVPKSHFNTIGRAEQDEIDALAGQQVDMVILELSDFVKRKYVCSRKKALRKKRLLELTKNDVVEGVVTSLTSYGAFVDLGGVDGLIHISRMSKMRVEKPEDIVKIGQTVKVRIVEIDEKEDRLALSMKEFTTSPWQHAEEKYTAGLVTKGKIQNITNFGVYVQLEPGITGMVHISDLSWTARVAHPSEIVKVGDEVEVKVISVRPRDRRISLSIKETQPDPWPRLANVFTPDSEASGTVKQIMDAGILVAMDHGLDCFVPRGKMGTRRGGGKRGGPQQPAAPTFNIGDVVHLKIIEMDPQKHSFVGAMVRDESSEPERRHHDRDRDTDYNIPRPTASDNAFRLGDIEGLHKLLNSTAFAEATAADEAANVPTSETSETVVNEIATETPAVEEPATETPAVEEPATETPAVEEPATETPAVEEPAEDATADEQPSNEDGDEKNSPVA